MPARFKGNRSYVLLREKCPGIGPFDTPNLLGAYALAHGIKDYTVLVVEPPVPLSRFQVIEGGNEPPPAA